MESFREVLGCLPTGVAVIAAQTEDGPVGVACNSFTSVSLEPPLVGFFVAKTSTTWPHIRRAGGFAANILASGQAGLCRTFAERGVDRFAGVAWSEGARGAPRIHGAAAWIECELAEVSQVGDHWFALGAVHDLEAADDTGALVFFGGGLHELVA